MHQQAGTATAYTPFMRRFRTLAAYAALAFGLVAWADSAGARSGEIRLSSIGDRISDSTTDLPDDTATVADKVAPSEHALVAQPYPGRPLGGALNHHGVAGGFAAGFLGSGVLGLLSGHGIVGELGGTASVLGLLFQIALIVVLGRLYWTWWHADRAAAFAGLSPRQLADAYGRPRREVRPDIDAAVGGSTASGPARHDSPGYSRR